MASFKPTTLPNEYEKTIAGITKLNTTAYHPQCDRMVERLNRALKSMLCRHAIYEIW